LEKLKNDFRLERRAKKAAPKNRFLILFTPCEQVPVDKNARYQRALWGIVLALLTGVTVRARGFGTSKIGQPS